MTVIVYRKGILAGDSCWSEEDGTITNIQNKLVRLPSGAIYGGAGACDDRALLRMLSNVSTPDQLPALRDLRRDELNGLECLLVLPDKSVWKVSGGIEDDSYGVCPVSTPWAAVGSGMFIAIGALAANATAEEAVRIACDWHTTCKRPVHTLELRPKQKKENETKRIRIDLPSDPVQQVPIGD